ncbi:MAG: hypothetical protein ACLGHN_01605 [Bacteriovoracia bacterium]
MKWTLYPENKDLTTTLPLSVEIEQWEGKPSVKVEGLGELKLKEQNNKMRSEFYFTLPGKYKIEIKDRVSTEVKVLTVSEHQYLNFTNEFGFFFVLFLIVMGGIVLWTRKIMLK